MNESVSEWVTFLSSPFPLFFASFILLLEKKNDFIVQIKNLKHAGVKKGAGRVWGLGGGAVQQKSTHTQKKPNKASP